MAARLEKLNPSQAVAQDGIPGRPTTILEEVGLRFVPVTSSHGDNAGFHYASDSAIHAKAFGILLAFGSANHDDNVGLLSNSCSGNLGMNPGSLLSGGGLQDISMSLIVSALKL